MIIRVLAVSVALGTLLAGTAVAGTFKSKVVAHDRVANRIVVQDLSIVQYDKDTEVSDEVKVGDSIEVVFSGSEGQMDKIVKITVVEPAK